MKIYNLETEPGSGKMFFCEIACSTFIQFRCFLDARSEKYANFLSSFLMFSHKMEENEKFFLENLFQRHKHCIPVSFLLFQSLTLFYLYFREVERG
jgi:hypothetical protein